MLRNLLMHLAVTAAVCAASLTCAVNVALSQEPPLRKEPPHLSISTEPPPVQLGSESPRITAAYSYTIGARQERAIRQLTEQMALRDDLQKSVQLEKANETPLTTLLNLSRFLTSRGYKPSVGSPLIDLTF